mmetsp:Transcript_17392/g.37687  ORF Transcript_17392/g.37687 Transcript_17392/m.37687 type:complete len:335 (-) Transcript_17392:983-1987(-)
MMASTRPHQDQGLQCGGGGQPARRTSRSTQSKLTFSRRRLVDVGKETMNIGEKGYYVNRLGWTIDISQALQEAKTKSEHYHFEHKFSPPDKKVLGKYTTRFTIAYGTPLFIASKLQHVADGGHVAVLNSASSKNPGGRVLKGTLSAEDCLCRASLLYPCLFQYYGRRDHYYDINLSPPHNGQTSSKCAIYSPRVPIIREDTVEAPLLDQPEYVSFVSIPATNAFTHGKLPNEDACPEEEYERRRQALRADMSDRIYRALSIMAEHGCTDIVLGAFGCGVHGNDPHMVADIFKQLLEKDFAGVFQRVVFAIQPSRRMNYQAFTKHFGVSEQGDDS